MDKFLSRDNSDQAEKLWAKEVGLVPASKPPVWIKDPYGISYGLDSVYDHSSLWKEKGSRKHAADVLILQPYGFGLNGMKELINFAEKYDVDAFVLDGSWWVPGRTVMIALTRLKRDLSNQALWQIPYYTVNT